MRLHNRGFFHLLYTTGFTLVLEINIIFLVLLFPNTDPAESTETMLVDSTNQGTGKSCSEVVHSKNQSTNPRDPPLEHPRNTILHSNIPETPSTKHHP